MYSTIDLYRCENFRKIKNLFTSTTFIPLINRETLIRGNYLVSDGNTECNIYCDSDNIREIFRLNTGCVLEIRSDAMTNNKSSYGISDLHHIKKKLDNKKEYYEFKYVVKNEFMDKFINRVHNVYIHLSIPGEGYIDTQTIIGIMISPKLYTNTILLNNTIMNHISKLFKQLCSEKIEEYKKTDALGMLAVFESYISGKLKHENYVEILSSYAQSIYCIDGDIPHKNMSRSNYNYLENSGISALCNLCVAIELVSLKRYIYEIVLFITNNERLSKRIMDDPSLLVNKNVRYNMSNIWINIKKLVGYYINIGNKNKSDVHTIIGTLNGLERVLSGNN